MHRIFQISFICFEILETNYKLPLPEQRHYIYCFCVTYHHNFASENPIMLLILFLSP